MAESLAALKERVDLALSSYLPTGSELAPALVEAMRYAAIGGGKRLRPMFVLATCEALGGQIEDALPAACAVELMHTYSLVHDDLPAMDDDALRHGKPATHIAYGEANAILTGDALQALAFEILAEMGLPPATRARCVLSLARAAGWKGMVGGQALDMLLPDLADEAVPLEQLQALHSAKSGALICASIRIGAEIAGGGEVVLSGLHAFGERIGLAFQIVDDVLDETASTEALGKPARSDVIEGKHTFVRHMGLQGATEAAQKLLEEGLAQLGALDLGDTRLAELANLCVNRTR